MTPIQRWFLASTVLAFVAGGGVSLLADRVWQEKEPAATPGDAEGYLREFERRIGIEDDEQRRALRSAYEQYWIQLRELERLVIVEHRADLLRIEQSFHHRVSQLLDEDQRRLWEKATGRPVGGTAPTDTGTGRGGAGEDLRGEPHAEEK